MQQNRDRNGRPRNPRPYDLNRDVARTSAPSQNHTPRSTGSSRYGYNGEPLSRPPSRSANGSVRSSRADNSIQFPTQTQSQPRRPAQEVIAAQDREYIDALEKSKVDKNVQVVQNSDCTMSFKAGDTINLSTEESKISRIYCSS